MFLAAALAALVAFPGCGDDENASLEGTWELDAPSTVESARKGFSSLVAKMAERDRASMHAAHDRMLKAMEGQSGTLVAKAGGAWKSSLNLATSAGLDGIKEWELKEWGRWEMDGNKVTLTIFIRDGESLEWPDVLIGTVKGDELRMRPKQDGLYDTVMRRKK